MNKGDVFDVLDLILNFKHSRDDELTKNADRLILFLYTYMRYFRAHLPTPVGDIFALHQGQLHRAYEVYMQAQIDADHKTPSECEQALVVGAECREIIFQIISSFNLRRCNRLADTIHLIPDKYRDLISHKYGSSSSVHVKQEPSRSRPGKNQEQQ